MALRLLPVDGVAIVLISSAGHRVLRSAAGRSADRLEELSALCAEGPAVDAPALGVPVLANDLTMANSRDRWPLFSSEALGLGIAAVLAMPLRIGAISLGAFVLNRSVPGALRAGDLRRALAMADAAAYLVLDPEPVLQPSPAADLAPQPDPLAYVGAEIHQASGMLMIQLGISIDAALARLRAYAFAHDQPLAEVARAVIDRTLRFER